MVQPDMKKLVAYSSVSHLGFVVLGICAMNVQGVQGAVYQMLAHGVSTGGLFLIVGMLSDRRHTRLISEFGGLKRVMPRLTAAFLIITLASIGMPGLNGFVGEFLIMLGAFRWDPRYVVGAGLGVILSAVYMLWMFQRVFYGEVTNEENADLPDLQPREWAAVVPLCAMAIVMGVLPDAVPASRWSRRCASWSSGAVGAAAAGANERRTSGRVDVDRRAGRRRRPVASRTSPNDLNAESCSTPTSTPSSRCSASRWRRWPSMGAEAFRGKGERMPIGGLGIIGLVGAAVSSALLWNRNADELRRHRRRQLRPVRHLRAGRRRHPDDHVLVAGGRARRHAGGRVLRAGAVLDRRHDHDGDGERPAGHLHRARDPVARRLRADRHPPRQRRAAPRRRSSTSCSARSRARSSSTASPSPTA